MLAVNYNDTSVQVLKNDVSSYKNLRGFDDIHSSLEEIDRIAKELLDEADRTIDSLRNAILHVEARRRELESKISSDPDNADQYRKELANLPDGAMRSCLEDLKYERNKFHTWMPCIYNVRKEAKSEEQTARNRTYSVYLEINNYMGVMKRYFKAGL